MTVVKSRRIHKGYWVDTREYSISMLEAPQLRFVEDLVFYGGSTLDI